MLAKIGRAALVGLRILLGIALLVPIPLLMVWFNQTAAENAAADAVQFERDSALALLDGQTLAKGNQLNERLVLSQLIENLEEPFDTIAIGSSRVMQLTAELAGVDNFYNCGLSGADYRDIMNIYYQFEKAGKLPENIIFALDPWILNADPTKLHSQSDADLFTEFITKRLGYQTGYVPPPEEAEVDYPHLLNPATFQSNLEYAMNEPEETPPDIVTEDFENQPSQLKMPDGTALYPVSYREAGVELSSEWARQEATTFLHMDGYVAPDKDLCLLFHRFIQYVKSQDVNVIFLLMPYNPIVYEYASERTDIYPGFFLTEPWFTEYATMYDIPLYGSYNPFVTDTQGDQFYDGLHVKGEAIPTFFPGVPGVLKAQEKDEAYSPWLLGGPRVQYATAQRLVEERYGIAEPEVAKRGLDEVIEGEMCYLVHRYSDGGDAPVHLATYAVSRREGVIYRWDTDLSVWVVDERTPR